MTISCIDRPRPDSSWRPPRRNLDAGAVSDAAGAPLHRCMHGLWLQDIESLEAISQNDDARKIFLKMAAMSQAGQMNTFLHELQLDGELDDDTKGTLTE